jgi:two-component system, cell cycle sensor histidine kinase and response regulator CckA
VVGARPGRHVVVSVDDTGTGIAPDLLEKVFEPFFTTKEVGRGTGLGLSTSLAIVRSHGGFIEVSSKAGEGTSFKVWLPLATGTSVAPLPEPVTAPAGAGQTVLVVDDEAAIREITREMLESQGYHVLTAGDGAEAVSVFTQKRRQIDVVLTDMNMPVMDGAATVAALRRIDPHLRVVAVSGRDLPQALREGRLAVQALLAKPYAAGQLLSTLAEVLGTPPDRSTPSHDRVVPVLEDGNGVR